MMKKLFSVIFGFVFCLSVYAQSDVSQQVFPKRIFVGDTAEIRYNFRSSIDFFPENAETDEMNISLSSLPFETDNSEYTIQKVLLQRNGPSYTLIFTFIPWKTGKLKIQAFDLVKVLMGQSAVPFEIAVQSFEVLSILNNEEPVLRPQASPLLLPGTIYIVYAAVIIALVLICEIVHLFVIRAKILQSLKNHFTLKNYAKNARRTLRHLKKLFKKNQLLSDSDYCRKLQILMRKYLTIRFGLNFFAFSTNQFVPGIEKATGGFLSDSKYEKLTSLNGLFTRCDYIRFAHISDLGENERESLYVQAREIVQVFETADVEEEIKKEIK